MKHNCSDNPAVSFISVADETTAFCVMCVMCVMYVMCPDATADTSVATL